MTIDELIDEMKSMYICKIEISEDWNEGTTHVEIDYQNGEHEDYDYTEE